jgi:pimeloyl-ACP methyl ester carboxylesterase
LSGHGESDDIDTPAGPETLRAYADDVCAVARETGADVLVGNSLGGAVVQHVLLEREVGPEAAVLAGSGAKLAVAESLRDALAEDFEAAIEALHSDDRLFQDARPRLVEQSEETMRAVGRAVTERDFLTCHPFDVRERVGDIDVPVLAVVGDHDQLTPVSYHEYLAERISGGRLAVVEDAAHLAMVERPAAFADAIGTFLDDVR